MRRPLALAVVVAWLIAMPAFANPLPPSATTSAATAVGLTAATVRGTVDPNGAATSYHVEYGTTTAYGLMTGGRSAGAGSDAVAIGVGLTGLTADTTYHFRVVATNAAGIGRSADRTLRTTRPAQPLPPLVSSGAVRDLAARSGTLTGSVNPRGSTTRYQFDYGTATSLNRHTPLNAAGAGTTSMAVSAVLTLTPNTRYSYRLRATNAAGTVLGARRAFTSPRAPALLTFALESNRVPYEGAAIATGSATSAGAGGVTVVLERQAFPFTGPFTQVATTRSANDGSYRLTLSPLRLRSRLRVVARTVPSVTSVARTVRATMRVGMTATRLRHRRVRFSGAVLPAASGSRASLQRRVRGRFRTLRRAHVRSGGPTGANYRITIAARRSGAVYRVLVTPVRSSGQDSGTSRTQHVSGLRHR